VDATTTATAPLVLEVGVGSGVVLAFVAANAQTIFGRNDLLTLGTDTNSFACQAASRTVQKAIEPNHGSATFLDIVNVDLASSIASSSIDVLIFNPPYVPTPELPDLTLHHDFNSVPLNQSAPSFEQDSHLLSLSYAGGAEGMEVTNRMLDQIPRILDPQRGVAYILLCAQNKPELVKSRIRGWANDWSADTVGTSGKTAGWEKLQIVRIWKTRPETVGR
jgi:release factor glutamine methyltransferase